MHRHWYTHTHYSQYLHGTKSLSSHGGDVGDIPVEGAAPVGVGVDDHLNVRLSIGDLLGLLVAIEQDR